MADSGWETREPTKQCRTMQTHLSSPPEAAPLTSEARAHTSGHVVLYDRDIERTLETTATGNPAP